MVRSIYGQQLYRVTHWGSGRGSERILFPLSVELRDEFGLRVDQSEPSHVDGAEFENPG